MTKRQIYMKEYNKKYQEERKEYLKEYKKQHALKNKDSYRNAKKRFKDRNPDYNKIYYKENIEYENQRSRAYKKENKEKINSYSSKRYKNDINYKLKVLLRTRIKSAIKNNQKMGSAVKDLGCNMQELKKHLESKFKSGMTWKNYGRGGWEIDHIIPLSNFNLKNREEFLKACHHTNLQPLWAKENRSKGNRI